MMYIRQIKSKYTKCFLGTNRIKSLIKGIEGHKMGANLTSHFEATVFCKSIIYLIVYVFMLQSCVWMMPLPAGRNLNTTMTMKVKCQRPNVQDVVTISKYTIP